MAYTLLILSLALAINLEPIISVDYDRVFKLHGQEVSVESEVTLETISNAYLNYYHVIDLVYAPNLIDLLAFDSRKNILNVEKIPNELVDQNIRYSSYQKESSNLQNITPIKHRIQAN